MKDELRRRLERDGDPDTFRKRLREQERAGEFLAPILRPEPGTNNPILLAYLAPMSMAERIEVLQRIVYNATLGLPMHLTPVLRGFNSRGRINYGELNAYRELRDRVIREAEYVTVRHNYTIKM